MTLEEFYDLVSKYTSEFDRNAVVRGYSVLKKENALDDIRQVQKYIEEHLPPEAMIAVRTVLMPYGDASALEVGYAVKWLLKHNEPVMDTLRGEYVSELSAGKLRSFLDSAIPVRKEFENFCSMRNLPISPALFRYFTDRNKKKLIQTRYHPFCNEDYFCVNGAESLQDMLEVWYAEYCMDMPSEKEGYLSVRQSAEKLQIKPQKMWEWIHNHMDSVLIWEGKYLISEKTVQGWSAQWRGIVDTETLMRAELNEVPKKMRMQVKEQLMRHLKSHKPAWILPEGTYPQQLCGKSYIMHLSNAKKEIKEIISDLPVFPIAELKETTGMTFSKIKEKVIGGTIDAVNQGDENNPIFYVSQNEKTRIEAINNHFLCMDDIVLQYVSDEPTNFCYTKQYDRDNLIMFCENNEWWEADYIKCDALPLDGKKFGYAVAKTDSGIIKEHIGLWLQRYQKSHLDQFRLLTDRIAEKFPATSHKLIEFELKKHRADNPLVDLSELLFLSLKEELKKMTEDEIEETIVKRFNNEATRSACNLLADFLEFGDYTKRKFEFSETGDSVDTRAYSVTDFAVMVLYIVNEEAIEKAGLIQKAIRNKRFARLWLYVALHIFAAWRSTDYIRMLAPKLPYSAELVLEKIEMGIFHETDAVKIAEHFIAMNSLCLNKPNKTFGTSGVPNLYFYCPRDCLRMFGIILAIAAAHYQIQGAVDSFVSPVTDWYTIKQFFGEMFARACGNRSFSGRRANKALLQSIELVGREDNLLPPLVAYNLASIMRSHKLNYGGISDTTDFYLSDANFSGLTPEYVIYQMWNRGVCSFLVDAMLKICYGEGYTNLYESQKTKVIEKLGLTPSDVINIMEMVQTAQDKAVEIVRAVFQNRQTIDHALKTIALGNGTGKEPGVYCLWKAKGEKCVCSERLNCLGCLYEIPTKSFLLRCAVVHHQLCQISDDDTELDKARKLYLRNKVTFPVVAEIVTHLEASTTDSEFALYKALIEEEKNYGITDDSSP